MRLPLRATVPALLFTCAALAAPTPLQAQGDYFGRNKVQYQEFDFKLLQTDHFDIYFYPEEEDAARMASRLAERWYARLATLLGHQLRGRQPLILYASGPHFWQTNTIEGTLGEGTGGVTEAAKRRIATGTRSGRSSAESTGIVWSAICYAPASAAAGTTRRSSRFWALNRRS